MPERLKHGPEFDVLGDILETLRFRGSVFFRSDLAAPWGMSLPEIGIPRFHIMLSGECFIGSDAHAMSRPDVKIANTAARKPLRSPLPTLAVSVFTYRPSLRPFSFIL